RVVTAQKINARVIFGKNKSAILALNHLVIILPTPKCLLATGAERTLAEAGMVRERHKRAQYNRRIFGCKRAPLTTDLFLCAVRSGQPFQPNPKCPENHCRGPRIS